MKVIFLKNLPSVAKMGDIKDVSDGYAMNFLFPQKIAYAANPNNIAHVKHQQDHQKDNLQRKIKDISSLYKKLSRKKIIMSTPANPEGTLFAALHARDVAKKLSEMKFRMEPKYLFLENPIKTTGDFTVGIVVGEKKIGDIAVSVVSDTPSQK